MKFYDWFSFISLILFFITLIGRTVMLHIKGTIAFVIGKGKNKFDSFLEIIFIILLLLWIYELVVFSFKINYSSYDF